MLTFAWSEQAYSLLAVAAKNARSHVVHKVLFVHCVASNCMVLTRLLCTILCHATHTGMVVLSASLDGTVRAFDLVRYRNFRTFTSPEPTQFNCLGVDPSGELVAAGCGDSFDICLWSMKTGRLLDILAGHEAPVSAVEFSPTRSVLASSSWDGSTRIWDIFEHKAAKVLCSPCVGEVICKEYPCG